MQIEKLVDAAVDYRISKLKAREQGIIGVTDCGGSREEFQIYDKDDFKEIIKTRKYSICRNSEYYEYSTQVAGLTFICLTPFLFDFDDKDKIEGDKQWISN